MPSPNNVMKIPYARTLLGADELYAASSALSSGQWVHGSETIAFEEELAIAQDVQHALMVNSGSSALLTACLALAEKYPILLCREPFEHRGRVIVPAIQFPTLTTSLLLAGFQPVVVDVNLTLNLNPSDVLKAVEYYSDVVGIAAVHLAGNVADMSALKKIALYHNLFLLEDCCDGLGGTYRSRLVGTFGDIAVTSFHMAHTISTGQGGAVFTNDDQLANAAKSIRDWGRLEPFDDSKPGIAPLPVDHMQRYTYQRWGLNLAPLELQAAIGRVQLPKLPGFVDLRHQNYTKISTWANQAGLQTPVVLDFARPSWFTVPMMVPQGVERAPVLARLREWDIEYRNILSGNITLHPAFINEERLEKFGDLPYATDIGARGFWISCHSTLVPKELDYLFRFFESLDDLVKVR